MLRDPLRDPHALSILSFEKIRRIQNFSGLRAPKKAPESKSLWSTSMNERIKELVGRAEAYAYEHEEHWHDGPDWQELFNKKFAELIVEECANVADENYIHRGSRTCGLAIRLHFGVEE